MTESYSEEIAAATTLFVDAVLRNQTDLTEIAREIDSVILPHIRELGRRICEEVQNAASRRLTEEAKNTGLTVERRPVVRFYGVFGPMDVESPYLYDRTTRRSARPAKDALGITHCGRSDAVERALTDFGIEASYGRAAERFAEHYGFTMHRTTIRRVVNRRAESAERLLEKRLASEEPGLTASTATRRVGDMVLTELDGSMVRTGVLEPASEAGLTPVRKLPRRQRPERWREARVGMVRQLDQADASYTARIGRYPDVVWDLLRTAAGHGLHPGSTTIVVADGGNGLMEEMLTQFPNPKFILDRAHLMQHLHDTVAAMGLQGKAREEWLTQQKTAIDGGQVSQALQRLRTYRGKGRKRVQQFCDYLTRFRDCVHYDAYKARGLPIGSGEVESAHDWLVQQRMKLPGACWHPDTVNRILALRVVRANRSWDELWQDNEAA